ncbi:CLUMA_CG005080, isoform A [Clunio marinus]|uniref:Nitrilase and fragile histidine triad fusion protein NitFhit n=1 Tax=Clunio marinus TaxID=568069 RepID=A0A1J1HTL9_9DIPT|nr:CLUMA_CG005080, isoform A [Clunio marinus]
MSTSTKNVIGLCQMRTTNDKKINREQVAELVSRAKGKTNFLFFPECCDYVGTNVEETKRLSEPLTGETVQFYKDLCVKNQMWMSFGGVHECIINEDGERNEKICNTHIIINSEGELAGVYRKLHLFDVDTPEFKFRESKIVKPGEGATKPVTTSIGSIGMQICYDIRFPETPIWLKSHGAQIITYPSAFSVSTGKAHWDILNRSRAIENQCFVISAAQFGKHNEKRSSYGHAIAVSPWGDVLAECSEELEVQFVEIDLEKISKVERNMPCFKHRRYDIYSMEMKTANQLESKESEQAFMFEKYPINCQTIFYETEHSVAFTNIRCVVPGHVLVATKRSIARVEEMTHDETKDLFVVACKIAKVLDDYYEAKSTTITVQDGEYAGQTVKHVHCHIMPRKPGDFEHNDEIYVKLNEHDSKNVKEEKRPMQVMIDEAKIYKKLLSS